LVRNVVPCQNNVLFVLLLRDLRKDEL
jgi:hypothetical protein